ncbi:pentapeptide repeat-containing protein [Streptomyces sp. NPDC021098]|uniref:pentapeptide repeat-containing protein n=1 Tax=unclassified Streptomyces TaxID=2593676 RepID=UPI0037A7DEDF
MTSASSEPSHTSPNWPHCGLGATPENPIGCPGIHVAGYTACLAHLNETDRAAYLTTLAPGAEVDHRGTPFTEDLLRQLLDALHDPLTSHPHLGKALFNGATFSGAGATDGFDSASFFGEACFVGASFFSKADFHRASFFGKASFGAASFSSIADFAGASFSGEASFHEASFFNPTLFYEASFSSEASFVGASFSTYTWFDRASFSSKAEFSRASFSYPAFFLKTSFFGEASFTMASFSGSAHFDGASFSGDAVFAGVRFETTQWLGPLVCGGHVMLNRAVFGAPVTVEIAARKVTCVRTQWESIATMRLRYADLDLSDAALEYPLTVAARPAPFPDNSSGRLPETELRGHEPGVRLTSVDGVDAAHLVLHNIALDACRFAGAIHLDQLRVDGWCTFAETPSGNRYQRLLWRWSPRRTLVEEHHWRAQAVRSARSRGWLSPPENVAVLQPAALAALYRQVRKSLEDGKNEPDAADFYFGEMEMRRHDVTRPAGERVLLTAYWALSGYGLRAIRALAWLGAAMTATLLALTLWGLPASEPKPGITGRQVAVGRDITLTTHTPDPANPTGPWAERLTTERFEKALRVVINSVAFRSSGQDLTTTGTYTEMASRITEPVLLGLAALAIRSRVKR